MIIKARPLTIRKPPLSEQPKLRNAKNGISNRRIEMPPAFLFPEMEDDKERLKKDEPLNNNISSDKEDKDVSDIAEQISSVDINQESRNDVVRRSKKGNLKQGGKAPLARRVSFDPLALLLDASLEGELELVKKTATQVFTLLHHAEDIFSIFLA